MRVLLVVLMVIGSILLAFLLAGILFSNLRFFIWLAIIGLVIWGIYMLITRPWRYSLSKAWRGCRRRRQQARAFL
jgi:Zn-dependent membrane protease YugP